MHSPLPTSAELRAMSRDAGFPDRTSIVIERLDARALTTLEPDLPIYPASVLKVPLVAAALAEVQNGRLVLTERYEVTAANMTVNDAGSPLIPGYHGSLEELCKRAVSRSDNVATNMLFDIVGRERATEIVRDRFSLRATAFYRKLSGSDPLIVDPDWDGVHMNTHPAGDAARMLRAIAGNAVPYAEMQRAYLAGQLWNDKLPLGLNPGDRFDHKTGETSTVTHDAGILTTSTGGSYVIVVYTEFTGAEERDAWFVAFMKLLRPHLAR